MTNLEAVIEIGSTGIRLLVAQIKSSASKWSIIDRSEMPVSLGKDVFTDGIISRETLLQCLHIFYLFPKSPNP